MGNFYTFALLELFLHCYTLGKKHFGQFYPGQIFFTLALLVLLVTNFMSGHKKKKNQKLEQKENKDEEGCLVCFKLQRQEQQT